MGVVGINTYWEMLTNSLRVIVNNSFTKKKKKKKIL